MVVYGLYLYIVVDYMREIFIRCISTIRERVKERVIILVGQVFEPNQAGPKYVRFKKKGMLHPIYTL